MQEYSEYKELLMHYGFTLAIALLIAWLAYWQLVRIYRRMSGQGPDKRVYKAIKSQCGKPVLMLFVSVFVLLAFKLHLSGSMHSSASETVRQIISIFIMVSFGWLMAGIVNAIEVYLTGVYDVSSKDNLKARKVHTQLRIMKKIAFVVIFVICFSCIVMTFEKARQFGTSLLASAGIIGIVIGLAAQKSIGTIIAGLQIAITQPIRIDDVVIVEGEWGNIEDITMTYVVVRIWDKRRLIVPINHFIEKPFQNWTRVSADLIGTIFLQVDYSVELDKLRDYFMSALAGNSRWDGKVACMQVTNCGERTVELRFLVGSPDASLAWELRCEMREKLLVFVRDNYPDSLPKFRASVSDKS
ncbi:MAG: mechanosensitive ion channel [Sedimentisphaerales bacterium]|nr:mechanosensitive ion channel [Sedimentisphaerales bacterium]MBN2843712.1 mechanosensitive ion channel [Sedimentisphaerales bacterium]